MTQALMPWHVLTHLTAIHLHGSQALGLGLGGHEFRELGGQRNHLDPAHLLAGIAAAPHESCLSIKDTHVNGVSIVLH